MEAPFSEEKLKEIMKAAIEEIIEERRDLISGIIEEAIEDVAMARAIEEGKDSGFVAREEVFALLEGKE